VARFDPRNYQTYSIHAPLSTHWRSISCAELGCANYLNGWTVRVEHLTPAQLHTCRTSGRRYTELAVREGENYLVYEAGQPCFEASAHVVRVERPELYVIRDGDTRANPTGRRAVVDGATWNDDFGEHQERIADLMKEG
jgi:hypothetical protein